MRTAVIPLNSNPPSYGIVVFSHLRWSFVWQRPQQFLSRFAEKHPVLFVEIAEFDGAGGPRVELTSPMAGVTVLNLHLDPSLQGTDAVTGEIRNAVREGMSHLGIENPLLWFYNPMDAGWVLGWLENRGVRVRLHGRVGAVQGRRPDARATRAAVARRRRRGVHRGHRTLRKEVEGAPERAFLRLRGGVRPLRPGPRESGPIPEDLAAIPGPRVGWFGVVDERVDYDLLRDMAAQRPDLSFVMVGPAVKVDPATFPQAPNLHWLGGRDYKELPLYCRGYDVCMMCFALNEATEFINPTKALEYLATGKPVVSTAVKDVVRQYEGHGRDRRFSPEEFLGEIDVGFRGWASRRWSSGASRRPGGLVGEHRRRDAKRIIDAALVARPSQLSCLTNHAPGILLLASLSALYRRRRALHRKAGPAERASAVQGRHRTDTTGGRSLFSP